MLAVGFVILIKKPFFLSSDMIIMFLEVTSLLWLAPTKRLVLNNLPSMLPFQSSENFSGTHFLNVSYIFRNFSCISLIRFVLSGFCLWSIIVKDIRVILITVEGKRKEKIYICTVNRVWKFLTLLKKVDFDGNV